VLARFHGAGFLFLVIDIVSVCWWLHVEPKSKCVVFIVGRKNVLKPVILNCGKVCKNE
jgi:hypothetical protein